MSIDHTSPTDTIEVDERDDHTPDRDDTDRVTDPREDDTEADDLESDAAVEAFLASGRTQRRGMSAATAGTVVLGVFLIAAAAVTAWLYFAEYRPGQATDPSAAQSALQAAQEGTVALLSYKPDTLDADLSAAKSHLTGEFLTYYTQFTDQIVKPAAEQKKVETTANVVRAAVSEMQPNNATVLVFVNQTTLSTDRPDPTMANSSVLVHLTKIDGRWLISEFKPV